MSEISAPIVAINPDIAPTDVDSLRRHGVEPIMLEGVGHFLMLEAPERFNAVLVKHWRPSSPSRALHQARALHEHAATIDG